MRWKETDPKQYWEVLNTLKKGDNSQNELETEGNFFKLIEHFKNQGRCDTYNVNLKKETERYIVNHKNELKENLITDIPFSVSEIKKCINKLKMKKRVGPDHICNEVIKFSSIVTCKSMDKLVTLQLRTIGTNDGTIAHNIHTCICTTRMISR